MPEQNGGKVLFYSILFVLFYFPVKGWGRQFCGQVDISVCYKEDSQVPKYFGPSAVWLDG